MWTNVGSSVVVAYLVPNIQHSKQNQTNIGHKEIARIPRHECGEAIRDNDDDVETNPVVTEPWLPECFVREVIAIDALSVTGSHEADVRDPDTGPGNETCHRTDVQEPIEDCTAATRLIHESQKPEGSGENNGDTRHSPRSGKCKDLRGAFFLGQAN